MITTKQLWIRDVESIQGELYRISKMFEMLFSHTADEKLRGQAEQLRTRCVNLAGRYMTLGNAAALYPEEKNGSLSR